MELLKGFLDFFMHLDDYLKVFIKDYGILVYAILFLIIFVETGVVIMPFLPGDSLLFAAGTFCVAGGGLNLFILIPLLIIAAILGDSCNYYLGKTIGLKVLKWKIKGRQLVKETALDKTHLFFEKHGTKTIILARFVPIVRTLAPFVAGIGKMEFKTFFKFNIIGGFIWVILLTMAGYLFGNIPFVKKNFELVVFGIIGLSLLPILFEFIKAKTAKKA